MKVFISHANKDAALARKIATILKQDGLNVWNEEDEIMPGDNWAEKTSQALNESEAMVVLLTPEALESKNVLREIDYALSEEPYSHRLISVIVGNLEKLPEEKVPWILKRLDMITLPEEGRNEEDIKQIAEALKAKA
ncbi:MAG: toll/interleukin-1 receptor domain-containing protein [Flavisolibacter sp.]|nr:toll/interleukin-1 receptor domain-containing protein [Flavisolibacter sp.]